jgi:predicted O-linked N-acetylglucosamine transferase (SPINDLY family)
LANADARTGRIESARRRYEGALSADPRNASAAANLGGLLISRREYSAALRHLEDAARLDPANADVQVNIGRVFSECGHAGRARAAFERALRLRPDDRAASSNLLLALHYCDDISPEDLARAHREFGAGLESAGVASRPAVTAGRSWPLRVGLLSGDFNDHAVMRFLVPLLEACDPATIAWHCYYTAYREDDYTKLARSHAHSFEKVAAMSDAELATRVRTDDLDVLIDLAGHSAGGRPGVLAMRPAPLQISWIGYLDTLGLKAIDYRITDAQADPPGLTDSLHVERLWRLDTLWCYGPPVDAPDPGPLPLAGRGAVTFGSTNNPAKLSDSLLSLWSELLGALPGSRLLLHAHGDSLCRDRISKAFAAHGIGAERVTFRDRAPPREYLRAYQEIDIVLDTWPYSGGTTSCDALWMGVPVVALAGNRPLSRTSASVLAAAGFPEWISGDRADYHRIARTLASDPTALASIRAQMRARVARSKLCDARKMASDLTGALLAMWTATGLPERKS